MRYTCPTCGRISYHPMDEQERYCSVCGYEPYQCQDCHLTIHAFTRPPRMRCMTCDFIRRAIPPDEQDAVRQLITGIEP